MSVRFKWNPRDVRRALACLALVITPLFAHASLTVLVGEPYGSFGTMMPVGHTAVYLDHLCADGPTKLRNCMVNEPQGVVIARYHRIGQLDWIATPIMQFLYATNTPQNVPEYVTPELEWTLRDRYRTQFLQSIVPNGTERDKKNDEWVETAGAAFDRRLWGYQVQTTAEQDSALIEALNNDPNRHRYALRNANCANFAQNVVNLYFPGTVKRLGRISDFGILSPKQVARSLYLYGKSHPEAQLKVIEIPQIPGSLRRSRPVRGAAEGALTTKRYLFTLIAIQPEVPVLLTVLYLDHGRWQMNQHAEVVGPEAFALPVAVVAKTAVAETAAAEGSEEMENWER